MPPRHDFENFEKCCREKPENVLIHSPAKQGAREEFGLKTDDDIKSFIADGGLSDRVFVKTDIFKAAQDLRGQEMSADVYDFWSGTKFGYFALVHNPNNRAWLIKSFKSNEKENPRAQSSALEEVLALCKGGGTGHGEK